MTRLTNAQWSHDHFSLRLMVISILMLTACGGVEAPEPTPTAAPTTTPGSNITDTPASQVTPTQVPEPTPTSAPTATPTPEPTPEPTGTPSIYDFPLDGCSDKTKEFWVWNTAVMPPKSVLVPTTCRFTGPNAYLYVADDQWGTYVNDELARSLMVTFEYRATPDAWDPTVGVFENDQAIFGDIPDTLDNDPRMYVLLVDIPDYINDEGEVFSFDGYFNAYDQMTDEQATRSTFGLYHSNEVEMLYVNSRIRPVTEPYTLGVMAHELQHLIAYNYDTSEEVWMSESLAEVAMLVNGYFTDTNWVASYAADPSVPLLTNTASGNYGAYLLWGMYLYEQIGPGFMRVLEEEQRDGISGLETALKDVGLSTTFQELFLSWAAANVIQDRQYDSHYGYRFSQELPPMMPEALLSPVYGSVTSELEAFGVQYFEVGDLAQKTTVSVTSQGASNLVVQLVRYSLDNIAVETLDSSGPNGYSAELLPSSEYAWTVVVTNINSRGIDTGDVISYNVGLK